MVERSVRNTPTDIAAIRAAGSAWQSKSQGKGSALGAATRYGLPVNSNRVSRAPPSVIVAGSCFIFLIPGVYARAHGDWVTPVLSVLQVLLSFGADYCANADFLPKQSIALVCACDRGIATAFALWLVMLSMATVSPWMFLALTPLAPVLAWSRASRQAPASCHGLPYPG